MADERSGREGTSPAERRRIGGLVGAGLIVAALVAFVTQNTEDTPVTWLFIEATQPLWVIILISAVLGLVLGELGGWAMRRRRRRG